MKSLSLERTYKTSTVLSTVLHFEMGLLASVGGHLKQHIKERLLFQAFLKAAKIHWQPMGTSSVTRTHFEQ